MLGMVIKCLREQRNGSSYNTLDDLHSDVQYWLLRSEHLTEVDGRWILKDMTKFNNSGKNLVEYIHYLITTKGSAKHSYDSATESFGKCSSRWRGNALSG